MPTVIVETTTPEPCPHVFAGDTSDLVYFLSFAYATRYGSQHELSQASLLLRGEFKIDLKPLLTFADRSVEDPADADALERAWQDPTPLAECCRQVMTALDSGHAKLGELTQDFPSLRDRIAELEAMARWAAQRQARIRVTYNL